MKLIKTVMATALASLTLTATPAHAFQPTYTGQGHYSVYVPLWPETTIAENVARFCRSKGKNDFQLGPQMMFGEQDFICIGDDEEVVTSPNAVTPVIVPFFVF
jgi:hypothetical protein